MLNPIFLSNILLGGPQQTFMTAFNSCLHNTQKRLGQKASIGLDQRHDSTVNAFSSPPHCLHYLLSTLLSARGLPMLVVISNNVSLALFISDWEFGGLIAQFTVQRVCRTVNPAQLAWRGLLAASSAAVSAEYTLLVSN